MNKLYQYAFEYICWHLDTETEDNLISILQECINNGVDINHNNSILLLMAITWRKEKITNFVVDNGADVTTLSNKALLGAVSQQNIKLIKLLIAHGATTQNNSGILLEACNKNNFEIIDLLLDMGADVSADVNKAITDILNLDTIKYLVNKGADPFAGNNQLLINACCYDMTEIVEYVISVGANCSDQDNKAIRKYIPFSKLEILTLLLENGADPNAFL